MLRFSLLMVMLVAPAFAGGATAKQEAAVLTRALAYDRNLVTRAQGTVVLAVVSDTDDDPYVAAFTALTSKQINGLPFEVVQLPFVDVPTLAAELDTRNVAALYLAEQHAGSAAEVAAVAESRSILTMTGSEQGVIDGLAVGAVVVDGAPSLLVNLPASKAQGASLDATLLRLAKVFR